MPQPEVRDTSLEQPPMAEPRARSVDVPTKLSGACRPSIVNETDSKQATGKNTNLNRPEVRPRESLALRRLGGDQAAAPQVATAAAQSPQGLVVDMAHNSSSRCWTTSAANSEYSAQDRPLSVSIGTGSCAAPAERTMSSSNSANASLAPSLLYYNREPLRPKDFSAEVRAAMDVEQFAHQAELLLDMSAYSMEDIVEQMLEKVIENEGLGSDKVQLAREAIFIRGSSMLIARTIHGTAAADADAGCRSSLSNGFVNIAGDSRQQQQQLELKHDQSWLCALCNLAQISRRHMVIARFKGPINMGENAHEVRLFVLIVVPSQEKGTKREVETGRTFATMLSDAQFRQRLLRAPDELEFKALMMIKAKQLAQSGKVRNRHKYMLDPALSISLSSINTLENDTDASLSQHSLSVSRIKQHQGAIGKLVNNCADLNNNNNNDDAEFDGAFVKFNKNPRTSGLFDLIGSTMANNNETRRRLNHTAVDNSPLNDSKVEKNVKYDQYLGETDAATSGRESPPPPPSGCCNFLLSQIEFGRGFWNDLVRRARYYPSDFRDAFVGPPRTVQKSIATIWFLYFGILLPTIAFSSLNTQQTHGHMGDLRKAIVGQAIGGLGFALFGGQPLVIIMTTAPLCLYTKVIHQMCLDYGFHFPAMYAAVGLWNGFFLLIYSLFGFSKLMKWCTRSTEEIFALFIVVAFISDAMKDMKKNFNQFYYTAACETQNNQTAQTMLHNTNPTVPQNFSGKSSRELEDAFETSICRRETSLLFILLMLGTLWLAVSLYKFKKTPYLSPGKRDILADYALPTAVIFMSYVGSFVFDEIYVERFPPIQALQFERAQVELLPVSGILTSLGLGFTLSLLFFMDQNISAAMVNAPQNRLKKGCAYHYDLFVVGILNGFLALYGLPMMHGVLPHSPLHVRSLADIEEHVEEGHVREVIVNCRETRVTSIVAHLLVLASILLIPYPIAYIPRAVLNGLFLYMAVTSLDGLQMFERIMLLFTEQNKYPPNHYIRRCPQRKIHQFTILQLFQLIIMCLFGFSPINIVEMFFPVIIFLMIPFRHQIVPKYIGEKYLEALDGRH